MAVALGTASLRAVRPAAQDVPAPDLTAAYLLNFVRFTSWPDEALPERAAIVVCVSGDAWVADSLVDLTRGQMVDGHALSIRRSSLDAPLDSCHVVYGAGLDGRRAQALIRATSSLPILTVSDLSDFARRGGVANFFIDDGRLRFAVNPDAAERARLQISSRLLSLARIVRS
jgi:hypothetical protein